MMILIGSHWHKYHDEYMEVLEGCIEFTLEGKVTMLRPGDAPLRIPRMQVHSFKFLKGVPTVFTEKTDPAGDFKERFFAILLDTPDGQPTFVSALRSFYDGDTYAALPGGFKLLDQAVTLTLGAMVRFWYPVKI